MENKEKNFISAIVYLHNDDEYIVPFFRKLNEMLNTHFEKYELIAVNDASTDNSVAQLKTWASGLEKPLTILNMSLYQRCENAMNAGMDIAIGDYIFEFDSVLDGFDFNMAFQAYKKCLEGNDIVSLCPKTMNQSSKLFYWLFNKNCNSTYQLKTDFFRVVTRRAINRVHALSDYIPYRKAAYAVSGLKIATLDCDDMMRKAQSGRSQLAIDSLILYTCAGYKISIGITVMMLVAALLELVYVFAIYCIGKPIEGWTTTMIVLTFGFFGIFLTQTIAIKYLSILVDMVFRKQKYLIEGIEKIQK